MADLNPYDAPRHAERPPKRRIIWSAIGGGIVLLLTPPAVLVTIAGTCSATTNAPPERSLPILIAGPLIALSILMVLTAALDRWCGDGDRGRNRLGVLIATPVVVAIATAIGYGLALLTYELLGRGSAGFHTGAAIASVTIAYGVPFVALVAMLCVGWRVGR